MLALEKEPRPQGVLKLRGRDEYRIRIGDYRVLFLVDDQSRTVTIVAVVNRRDAYK
ncbi:MAG: type II toxin-antitoxin system RelE/ParE family toxin [Chloroflexi bacterium]|nr:type II toxin-antitoxin system RelE/ParE family toxin [Chloroflexota bacterium]